MVPSWGELLIRAAWLVRLEWRSLRRRYRHRQFAKSSVKRERENDPLYFEPGRPIRMTSNVELHQLTKDIFVEMYRR